MIYEMIVTIFRQMSVLMILALPIVLIAADIIFAVKKKKYLVFELAAFSVGGCHNRLT